jgi:hypothetical protein
MLKYWNIGMMGWRPCEAWADKRLRRRWLGSVFYRFFLNRYRGNSQNENCQVMVKVKVVVKENPLFFKKK